MVTTHENRRQAIKDMLVEGVTECAIGYFADPKTGEPFKACDRVHGTTVPSFDGMFTVPIKFEKGALVGDLPFYFCGGHVGHAKKAGLDVVPVHEIERRLKEMDGAAPAASSVTSPVAPQAATPKAPPAPVVAVIGRVPAARKGVPAPQPVVAHPQAPAPRKEEPKPQAKRGPHPRSARGHYLCLESSRAFEEAFVLKTGGLCSCGECDTKSGKGFATKNGDYKGQRFPLCPEGVNAGLRFCATLRRANRKPGVLIFTDENDWKRFDANLARKTQDDAIRGHAVLDGELTERDDQCAVTMCSAKKPTDRIARIVDGKVVEHKICTTCAAAARKLRFQLQDQGKRWDFHLLREGEKLSEQQVQNLRKAAKLLQAEKRQQKPAKGKKGGTVVAPAPATFAGKLVAAVQKAEARQAQVAAPQAESATAEPETEAAEASESATEASQTAEPAAEPTIASVPAAAPEATAPVLSEEGTVGSGSD